MKGLCKQYSFGARTGLDTQNLNFYALRLYHHMFYRLRKWTIDYALKCTITRVISYFRIHGLAHCWGSLKKCLMHTTLMKSARRVTSTNSDALLNGSRTLLIYTLIWHMHFWNRMPRVRHWTAARNRWTHPPAGYPGRDEGVGPGTTLGLGSLIISLLSIAVIAIAGNNKK